MAGVTTGNNMAENIVSSMFGLTPPQVQQQQQSQERDLSIQYAQMTPFERANSSMYQAGSQLTGAGLGLMGMQDPQMQAAKQAESLQKQIDHSTPEGLMQGAAMFNQAGNPRMAFMYQQAANAKAQELANINRTKAQEELYKAQAEKALQPPKEEPGAKYSSALGKLVYERSQFPVGSEEYKTYTQMIQAEIAAKRAPSEKVSAAANTPKLTKGQEAADREFGKEYAGWKATGGYADVEKQLQQLQRVSEELGKPGNDYTGPAAGLIPGKARAFTNPNAVNAQNLVEEVAQRNLRLVLGAQFTQVEGERLIARAYNPQLSPLENKKRVDALINQIRTAAQAKEEAAQYFEANGSLAGWKGKIPTLYDFESAIDAAGKQPTPQSNTGGWSIRRK